MAKQDRRIIKSANVYLNLPRTSARKGITPALIFLITGNPGLIGYYHDFLDHLTSVSPDGSKQDGRQQRDRRGTGRLTRSASEVEGEESILERTSSQRDSVVAGYSLGGFEVDDKHESEFETKSESEPRGKQQSSSSPPPLSPSISLSPSDIKSLQYPSGWSPDRKESYSLRDQIGLCYDRVRALTGKIVEIYGHSGSLEDGEGRERNEEKEGNLREEVQQGKAEGGVKVILIGHSVGAYIAMEMVKRHHHHHELHQTTAEEKDQPDETTYSNPSPSLSEAAEPTATPPNTSTSKGTRTTGFKISSLILLTPTILDISQSLNGRLVTPILTTYLPTVLSTLAQLTSRTLMTLTPSSVTRYLVSKITGMPYGSKALDVTVAFLTKTGCVRQSLDLARCEMQEIGGDLWGDEVWGGRSRSEAGVLARRVDFEEERDEREDREHYERGGDEWVAPRIYMLFAQMDRWVCDGTREQILGIVGGRFGDEDGDGDGDGDGQNERGIRGMGKRPRIVVDQDEGIVHAWCIKQSDVVAARVKGWLGELFETV